MNTTPKSHPVLRPETCLARARPVPLRLATLLLTAAAITTPLAAIEYDYTSADVQLMIDTMDVVDLGGATVLVDQMMTMDNSTTLKNATFIANGGSSAIFNTSGDLANITIDNVVFDAAGHDVGLLIFREVDNLLIRNSTFMNVGNTLNDKWAVKLGAVDDSFDNNRSTGLDIRDNDFLDNNTGTLETLLAANISGVITGNYFSGNTTVYADEVSIYPGSNDVRYWYNTHENSTSCAIGAKDSRNVWIHMNTVSYSADSYEAINMRDCVDSKVTYNTLTHTGVDNWGLGIGLEDTTSGYDGWQRYNERSENVRVTDNHVTGFRYGIAMAHSIPNRDLDQYLTVIDNNTLDSIIARPIRVGVSGEANDITALYIRNNDILNFVPPYGWIEAIQLYEVTGAVVTGNYIP